MGSEEQTLLNELGMRQSQTVLDNDTIPNANQSLTCFSCDEPISGLYCYACGNKNDNYRRSIWSLGIELFQSLTAFEGRIWRSLYSLILKPGEMAREFADGARQKWTSPIRLFLATSLLLFGYITLTDTQMVALGDLKNTSGSEDIGGPIRFGDGSTEFTQNLLFFVRSSDLKTPPEDSGEIQLSQMLQDFQSGWQNYEEDEDLQAAIDELTLLIEDSEPAEAQALSVVRRALELRQGTNPSEDSVDADTLLTDEELNAALSALPTSGGSMKISGADGQSINLDANGMAQLYDRILRNPQIINNQLNTKLKWAMFFMMPFAMFMGALFIRGRDTAMLYDHLVHAAYVHSFSFLLLFTFILIHQYTAASGLIAIYTLILLIYLPLSAKGAFKRGWFKSFLTAYGVGAMYTLTIFIISVFIIATALQSVAKEFDTGSATTETSETLDDSQNEALDPQTTTESPPSPQTQPPE